MSHRFLVLLRHAKSSWDNPALQDFDRPLARRGVKAAPRMGKAMQKLEISPDLVLCSTSMRTRETWALASATMPPAPEIRFEDGLYHAHEEALLARVRAIGDEAKTAMIVAHNPGLHDFARAMVADGDPERVQALVRKYPTAGVAVIRFPVSRWRDIAPGSGWLEHFLTPASVAASRH
jgi:phosphohistidine phosphatase